MSTAPECGGVTQARGGDGESGDEFDRDGVGIGHVTAPPRAAPRALRLGRWPRGPLPQAAGAAGAAREAGGGGGARAGAAGRTSRGSSNRKGNSRCRSGSKEVPENSQCPSNLCTNRVHMASSHSFLLDFFLSLQYTCPHKPPSSFYKS